MIVKMKKVLVIGCSGAGKSTFAKRIASKTALRYIATDPFYWGSDWKLVSDEKVLERVYRATSEETWILDGNFDSERKMVWQRADTIIWLDYSFLQVLTQVTRRNLALWLSQNPTWSGNRMTWKRAWSGIRHSVKSHRRKRLIYPDYLASLDDIQVLHFTKSQEAEAWLTTL